ncbi:hypothetical protein [Microlunatus parietis]|uniref:Uncharacterized protein n=1 Tax=Microlunatus parietis TaxID=682979 RepID=A0A7Y9I2X6_9ACTN|nr:hypothetical protein [Microlunatus parietis]NYE69203.1 hypothetical protein [Microlunatus parietis]
MAPFEYVSDLDLNLHHLLYAAAFGGVPGRARAQSVPGELVLNGRPEFERAVTYYRGRFAERDLLSDPELSALKTLLAFGDGSAPAGWSEVFEPLREPYAETDWPVHDKINKDWSQAVHERLSPLLPDVLNELERVFREPWPEGPIRVDAVWVGYALPAYTTPRPAHISCMTTHPHQRDWLTVEIVLHEASHLLAWPLICALRNRIDPSRKGHGDLWHVVLFLLTGETVRRALASIGVDHQPYLEATGLFDRAWPHFRRPVTEAWTGYLDGTVDWSEACDRLLAAVR